MKAAEEKKALFVLELRIARKEFGLCICQNRRRFNSERRNFFAHAIEPKRFPREQAFFFGSEDDRGGIAQHAIFSPRPVEPFLQMLERKRFFKPRIEHAVWKNVIWNSRAGVTPPCSEAQILTDAVDDYAIVLAAIF